MKLRKGARMRRFHDADVADQSGRVALVTGATGGLGLRVAQVLAAHGARVFVGSRNAQRGTAALDAVRALAAGPEPELVSLDLLSLESVAAAAADTRERTGDRLDLLVNNGGIMAPPLAFSVDGVESQWATNVLGAAALTWLALPAIEAVAGSRVVFVSSTRHASASLDEARVRADIRGSGYRGFDYYGRTKLADLLLTHELEHHFRRVGSSTLAVAAHPGFTATGIVGSGFAGLPAVLRPIANWGMGALGQRVEIGALPILYAATAPNVAGDDYFGPRTLGGLRGYPGRAVRSIASTDDDLSEMLVRVVAEFTGVRPPA
jgi:NAD(P)-dependent dehydrogenase (short-subunit alcohol dehydrogenase family)